MKRGREQAVHTREGRTTGLEVTGWCGRTGPSGTCLLKCSWVQPYPELESSGRRMSAGRGTRSSGVFPPELMASHVGRGSS